MNKQNILMWLWLQKCVGTAYDFRSVLSHFGSVQALYEADEQAIDEVQCLKRRTGIKERLNDKNLKPCEEIFDLCQKHRIDILTPDCEQYPKRLLDIKNYPAVLFVRGDVSALNSENCFSVIGSRTPCLYGEEVAENIVEGLVKDADAVIVSGGAIGIDSVAHKAALKSGGRTVLVMGCGFGTNYLPQNSDLRKAVAGSGALVSEYPPYSLVGANTFPERNRIVSGLSKAVVIIEAASYSGTFSTARHAIKQGRELFVLPGDVKSGNFEGSNQLLSEGAKPVFSHENILEFYSDSKKRRHGLLLKDGKAFENVGIASAEGIRVRSKKKKSRSETAREEKTEKIKENITKNLPEGISKNADIVYNIMSEGFLSLDEIALRSGIETRKVLAALTELQLEGIVRNDGPCRYELL